MLEGKMLLLSNPRPSGPAKYGRQAVFS